jgi:hypothetical protein
MIRTCFRGSIGKSGLYVKEEVSQAAMQTLEKDWGQRSEFQPNAR